MHEPEAAPPTFRIIAEFTPDAWTNSRKNNAFKTTDDFHQLHEQLFEFINKKDYELDEDPNSYSCEIIWAKRPHTKFLPGDLIYSNGGRDNVFVVRKN